jgi:hypothetical protein
MIMRNCIKVGGERNFDKYAISFSVYKIWD